MDEEELNMWRTEIDTLKQKVSRRKADENIVAFYGSSSIRLWDTMQEDLQPHDTINLGFGGSTFRYCAHFFEEVFEELEPAQIILYGGDNDISSLSVEQTVINFHLLLDKVAARYPQKPVSVISVKPSPERAHLQKEIQRLNTHLEKGLKEKIAKSTFIDVHTHMLGDDGKAQESLFLEDNLHMNEKGYAIWKEVLLEHLQADQ